MHDSAFNTNFIFSNGKMIMKVVGNISKTISHKIAKKSLKLFALKLVADCASDLNKPKPFIVIFGIESKDKATK